MAIDEPVVLKFKPTNSVIFGRVSGDDVRLKHDGYTLPEDEPFAVKSDLFLVGARGRLRCDFISLPSVDLKGRRGAFMESGFLFEHHFAPLP